METSYIKMLNDVGDEHKKGEVYEIDTETADKWVAAELAEIIENPLDKFSKALEERDAKLIEKLSESIKVESQPPSIRVKSEKPEQSVGHFFQTAYKALDKSFSSESKLKAINEISEVYHKSTLQMSDGILGGVLVPEVLMNSLIEQKGYATPFSDGAVNVPVPSGESFKLPALDQSITPDGSGQSSYNAGLNVFWQEELDTATETKINFQSVTLEPHRLSGYIPVGNQFMRQSILGASNLVNRLFGSQVKAKLEYSYLLADGVGKPLGFLDLTNGVSLGVARAGANKIAYSDVCDMWGRLSASSQGTAIWMIGQLAISDLLQMVDGAGNAVFHPSAQAGADMRLFNRPVFVSEFLPAVGTVRDLCLVDPSMYYKAISQQPTISISEHVRFLEDQTVFKMEFWGDGQAGVNFKTILGDGTSTVSPSVYLLA